MAITSNAHNTNALLLGTCEFSFAEGAVSLADTLKYPYMDLGNVIGYSINPSSELKEHVGCYRGVTRVDASRVINAKLSYKLNLDEFSMQNALFIWMGTKQADWTQTGAATACTTLPFTAFPAKLGYWYDLQRGTPGVRLRNITNGSLTFSVSKTENTDFEVDYEQGRVRFLTAQIADLTPTCTTTSIAATDAKSMRVITPLLNTRRSGMGRLSVFDGSSTNSIVMAHDDFSCDVTLDGNVDGGATDYCKYSLNVLVTSTVGSVLVRETAAGTTL